MKLEDFRELDELSDEDMHVAFEIYALNVMDNL